MPPLASRIYPKTTEIQEQPTPPKAPFDPGPNPWSPWGNGAPNRGILPPDFMYDFQTKHFYPDAFTFVRGTVDTSTPLRNTALQALSAAGIKIL
jgi:hypothetical protein